MSFLFITLPFLVPLVVAPAVLFFGLRKTILGVLGTALLMIAAPYIYFGIWGLKDGIPLADVFASLSITTRPMFIIVGYMLGWSAICAGVAATVVWVWTRWRAA